MDETTLSLHPPLSACWMKKGQQKAVPTPGVQERCHVFGVWDWHGDEVAWQTSRYKNSDAFCRFMDYLLTERFPDEKIVLVMDNASFHHSGKSRAMLSLFEQRLLLFWLPPYCSTELNPIERFWKHLKGQVCVNVLYPSLDDLIEAVEMELGRQNESDYSERILFSKQEVKTT